MDDRPVGGDRVRRGPRGRGNNDAVAEVRGQKLIIYEDFALHAHGRRASVDDDFVERRERQHFLDFIGVSLENRRLNPHLFLDVDLLVAAQPREDARKRGFQLAHGEILQETVDLLLESYHRRRRTIREKTRGFQDYPVPADSYHDVDDLRMEVRVELREIRETQVRTLVFLEKSLEIRVRAIVKEELDGIDAQ